MQIHQSAHQMQALGCKQPALPCRLLASSKRRLICLASSQEPGPSSSNNQDPVPWVDRLNRFDLQAPIPPSQQPVIVQPLGPSLMGDEGFRKWQDVKRTERQRMWNTIRESAAERYEQGLMPSWFDPRWLAQEEAPVNKMLREMGDQAYQYDDKWLGRPYDRMEDLIPEAGGGGNDDGQGGNGSRGGRQGRGWWRDDDPYWMMRDWGSHPMRWWTLGYAAVLAIGGLGIFTIYGSPESLIAGWAGAAALAVSSLAMSDMRTGVAGELGVKVAWAVCALFAIKDGIIGWAHDPRSGTQGYDYNNIRDFVERNSERPPWEWLVPRFPNLNLSAFGWSAVAMCTMLMWTGMSGEVDGALPMTPGAVYKSSDIILKHRVWKNWGYGDQAMRT